MNREVVSHEFVAILHAAAFVEAVTFARILRAACARSSN